MAQGFYRFTHINSNGTTAIPAVILVGSVTVNTAGTGGNTITLYDGDTGGTVIAVINSTAAVGTYLYDCFIFNQLVTVVLAGGGAADITVATY